MKQSTPLLPWFLLLLLGSGAESAENKSLGRLFFTPEQRTELDRQLLANPDQVSDDGTGSLTFNGEIRRNTTRRAHWINGKTADNDRQPAPSLAIGDTYHRQTGEQQSLLGDGRITIKPQRAAK